MLQVNNTMRRFATEIETAAIIERLQNLNGNKKFNTSFVKYVSPNVIKSRMDLVDNARENLTKVLVENGCVPFSKEVNGKTYYGLKFKGEEYSFSATEEEVASNFKGLVSTLVKEVFNDNQEVLDAQNNFLQSYWVGRDKFIKLIKMGYPLLTEGNMTKEEAFEYTRFTFTVKDFTSKFSSLVDDAKCLGSFLKNHDVKELIQLGFLNETEDDSRSEMHERQQKFLDSLSEDDLTIYFLSRTSKRFIESLFGDMGELRFDDMYSLNYIFESVVSCKGMTIPDKFKFNEQTGENVPCVVGSYTIWNRFYKYYEGGYVSKEFIATLGGSTVYAFDQYLLKKNNK